MAVLKDDLVDVPEDELVDDDFNWISEVEASDDECDPPHEIVDGSSDEGVPDVELAIEAKDLAEEEARPETSKACGVYHDRRSGPAEQHHHTQGSSLRQHSRSRGSSRSRSQRFSRRPSGRHARTSPSSDKCPSTTSIRRSYMPIILYANSL